MKEQLQKIIMEFPIDEISSQLEVLGFFRKASYGNLHGTAMGEVWQSPITPLTLVLHWNFGDITGSTIELHKWYRCDYMGSESGGILQTVEKNNE